MNQEELNYFQMQPIEVDDDTYYQHTMINRRQCPEGCNLDYYDQQEDLD